ncbi:hypothetical protein Efla_004842 [Eimeria flavescens]
MEEAHCVSLPRPGASDSRWDPLRKLIANTQSAHKPWLHWPATWQELRTSGDQKLLRDYLTSPDVQRERLEQVRRQFLLAAKEKDLTSEGAAVFLEGGTSDEWMLYSSDCNKAPFRQEAFFQYLIGVNEPDVLAALLLCSGELLLFIPRLSPDALRFMGPPRGPEFYGSRYSATDVIEIGEVKEIEGELKRRGVRTLHVLRGVNSDSGRPVHPPKALSSFSAFTIDDSSLYEILTNCRVHKTQLEVEHLAAACLCSSQGHCFVARHMRPKMVEGQGEALFKAYVGFAGGARHVAYDCICCAGVNASILHYGHAGRPNDATVADGDLLLYDMGGDFGGYATDITCTFPVNGTFTETQRAIYAAVLDAQKSVIESMRPGVRWTDMHRLAERLVFCRVHEVILASIWFAQKLGLVVGSLEECEAAGLGAVFMPHGLGHFLGMDTHDVGGFTSCFPPSTLPGLKYLRTTRVLQKGMFITVEPGCYFVDHLLSQAAANPFHAHLLDFKVIDKYRGIGGVRLEDDVLVTEDGVLNFTIVPRNVEDVEELVRLGVHSRAHPSSQLSAV